MPYELGNNLKQIINYKELGESDEPKRKSGLRQNLDSLGDLASKNINKLDAQMRNPDTQLDTILENSPLNGVGGIAGTFIGASSPLFNKAAEAFGRNMKSLGASAEEVWKETQTRFWKSGSRQEIDDSSARLTDDAVLDLTFFGGGKLYDILDHPDLYKAYPETKNISVSLNRNLNKGEAIFRPGTNEVLLSKETLNDPDETIKNLLHEAQHWIQVKEGWQSGGNPSQFVDSIIQRGNQLYVITPMHKYTALPGEVEARLTEKRVKLSAKERAEQFPDLDMDREVWKMELLHPDLVKK